MIYDKQEGNRVRVTRIENGITTQSELSNDKVSFKEFYKLWDMEVRLNKMKDNMNNLKFKFL